jgi:hypothetical protein
MQIQGTQPELKNRLGEGEFVMGTRSYSALATVAMVVLSIGCGSKGGAWEWLEQQPHPWTLSEEQVSALLPELQTHFPDFQERIKALAIWRVGTPYEIFKLGEEVEPDLDPLIRLDVSDCTGHILTTLSLAQSESWDQARETMVEIHYKPDSRGQKAPTYLSRWHYTTDRIISNPSTVDITRDLLKEEELKSVEIILNRKEDGNEFLELNWSRTMTTWYIPNDKINAELLGRLPEVCGVAFVKPSYFKLGIVVGHEGMIIDRKDLIHASQSAGKTERVDFLDYYFPKSGPFFDGIMIYQFVPLGG